MAPIRNVIFDLGGVLLEWKPQDILARCFPSAESQQMARRGLFGHSDWIAFDRGDLSEPDLITRGQARTGFTAQEITYYLDTIRDSLVAVPDAVALLHETKAHGAALYCLSNMPMSIFSHVRQRYSFWGEFAGIVVSGDVRMVKPDREIFEYVLSRHELRARETLFIDDLPQNVEAAKQIGIDGFVFRGFADCQRDLKARLRPGIE